VTMVMSVVYREIGPLHARYVLPFLVLVPLWCGEVVLRRRDDLPPGLASALPVLIFVVAAGVHVLGWWSSSRRFAVGEEGAWMFLGDAQWSPPAGWLPWVVLAALAVAAYVASPVAERASVR
jgi:neutral trehalase